jgi:hypothetical protein
MYYKSIDFRIITMKAIGQKLAYNTYVSKGHDSFPINSTSNKRISIGKHISYITFRPYYASM